MKITLAFAAALVLQAVSAASPSASPSVSSSSQLPASTGLATSSSIGDKAAQELAENFAIFRWEANNSLARESFAFELYEPSRLQVVDFKHHGDMFDIFDNGKKIGSSSNVVYDENVETYAATPQEALSDDHFSKGAFSLDKGNHNITIMAHGPYEVGSAALRLVQRTNLVLAQGQEEADGETEEESEEEEEEQEEEEEEENDEDNSGNWQKMYLKKKDHGGHKGWGGRRGRQYDHHRPYYKEKPYHKYYHHKKADHKPLTVTHWKVVTKTAVPYATRIGYEHESGDYK